MVDPAAVFCPGWIAIIACDSRPLSQVSEGENYFTLSLCPIAPPFRHVGNCTSDG